MSSWHHQTGAAKTTKYCTWRRSTPSSIPHTGFLPSSKVIVDHLPSLHRSQILWLHLSKCRELPLEQMPTVEHLELPKHR